MKKIVLTGGGTAGHVTPNMAIIPMLKEEGYDILYIGSKNGIEKRLIEDLGVPYRGISVGKLRRYLSVENLKDPFRIQKGVFEARKILKEYKPDIIFSKGGFVSVPVIAAARRLHIPALTHESDLTVGLANRLNLPGVKKLCVNFPETADTVKGDKAVVTGCPIRPALFEGDAEVGRKMTGLDRKPVLLVIGGSLGSVAINNAVREALPRLLEKFDVVHICGKDNVSSEHQDIPGYVQFDYISHGLKDIFALSDVVISRAGANAICELVALRKPNLLIPLPSKSSRGDQLLNAESFKKQGFSDVLPQEDITTDTLVDRVFALYENRENYIDAMKTSSHANSARIVVDLIKKYTK